MGADERFDLDREYTFTGEQLVRFAAQIMSAAKARKGQSPEEEMGRWYMRLRTMGGAEIILATALDHCGIDGGDAWEGWEILRKHAESTIASAGA